MTIVTLIVLLGISGAVIGSAFSAVRMRKDLTTPALIVDKARPAYNVHEGDKGRVYLSSEIIYHSWAEHPVGQVISTRDMRIVEMNPAAEETVGWTLEQLRERGGSFRDLIVPQDLPRAFDAIAKGEEGEAIAEHHNTWLGFDGEPRRLIWSASPFDDRGFSVSFVRPDLTAPRGG